MKIDDLLKQIQEWTNRIPLIILGSGASIPYGLPSMFTLGEYLKLNLNFKDTEDLSQFEEFKSKLDYFKDLETTLLNINLRKNVLSEIISATWQLVNSQDLLAFEKLLADDSIKFPLSELIKHLLSSSQKKVSILTTNYDRLAEYAASLANAFICTGYTQNYIGFFSKAIHQQDFSKLKGFNGQVNIWKVHGSLDWFSREDDSYVHLPSRLNILENHKPLIITPGLSKYLETQLEPFRTIFTEADNEIERANTFLCIGYGFNDIHVQPKLITQIKNGKPIIVISKELTPKSKESIINTGCKNYILIEQTNTNDSRIYTSAQAGEHIIPNSNFWELSKYLTLVRR